jgi:hypothetical protein
VKWIYFLLTFLSLAVTPVVQASEPIGENGFESTGLLPGDSSGFTGHEGESPSALAGKRRGLPFTRSGKSTVKQKNATKNDGKNRCENCGVETVPGQQHKKDVTPPNNETQVDHVIPRAKGGDGDPENGQVLCRECNIKKGDKEP